jgi:hypothetical protein
MVSGKFTVSKDHTLWCLGEGIKISKTGVVRDRRHPAWYVKERKDKGFFQPWTKEMEPCGIIPIPLDEAKKIAWDSNRDVDIDRVMTTFDNLMTSDDYLYNDPVRFKLSDNVKRVIVPSKEYILFSIPGEGMTCYSDYRDYQYGTAYRCDKESKLKGT